uniref:Protein kinase domain-containing protein n=1 Tax=Arcella intermedia TaxID=1963864 RepID=A0A6B2L067_9EUKA
MERPESTIGRYFSPEQMSKQTHIFRSFRFSFVPIGLFARFITVVLQIMSPSVLALWRQGFIFEVNEDTKTVKVLVENNFFDLGVEGFNNSTTSNGEGTYQIRLELISTDKAYCCDCFCRILDIMLTVAADWKKQNCTMFWESSMEPLSYPIGIDNLQRMYENNVVVVEMPGDFALDTAIPEFVIPSYKGNRYLQKEVTISGEVLGSGAFARVNVGTVGGKKVAVKEMFMCEDPALIRCRFLYEVMMQSRLSHPNIVAIEGICVSPFSILFEVCQAGDLLKLVENLERPISWSLRRKILVDIARGIEYLHELPVPIMHRDLKGLNILVFSCDEKDPVCAKVTDFGTAIKYTRPISTRVVDNPTWLAPEILEGKEYDLSIDVYAFGLISIETFTREQAFLGRWSETEERILSGERPHIPPECPDFFSTLLQNCWDQNPTSRPPWKSILSTLSKFEEMDPESYSALEAKNLEFYNKKLRRATLAQGKQDDRKLPTPTPSQPDYKAIVNISEDSSTDSTDNDLRESSKLSLSNGSVGVEQEEDFAKKADYESFIKKRMSKLGQSNRNIILGARKSSVAPTIREKEGEENLF